MPTSQTEQVDLHGAKKLVFLDWNEEETYLEAVTITDREQAVKVLAEEMAVEPDELNVVSVHMRYVENEGKEAWIDPDGVEYLEGWLECPADHPDAVPFWKDAI